MADRFPLILNTSTNQIQEIPSGDQLDLSGNNLANAGIITATTFSGNLTGNVTGNINGNLTGTLQTAAQPNITSLGTLSSLNVSGNASIGGVLTYEDVTNVDSVGIITARDDIKITTDNKSITMGAGADLSMKHDGTNSYILNNTGSFIISADTVQFNNRANNETKAKLINNGAVELYFDNSKVFETIGTGSGGAKFGNSLNIYRTASGNGNIQNTTGNLYIEAKANETSALFVADGEVQLMYNHVKKFETSNTGVTVTGTVAATTFSGSGANLTNLDASDLASGTVPTARLGSGTASSSTFLRGDSTFQTVNTDLVGDSSPQLGGALDTNEHCIDFGDSSGVNNDRLKFGDSDDLQIYHNTSSYVDSSSGHLYLRAGNGNMYLNPVNNETGIAAIANGAIELYHDNNKVCETITAGIRVQRLTATSTYIELQNSGGVAGYLYGENNNKLQLLDREGHFFLNGIKDGAVELYHNNIKKLETSSGGVDVTGTLEATGHPSSEPYAGVISTSSGANNHTGFFANAAAANAQTHMRFGYGGSPKWQVRVPFHTEGNGSDIRFYTFVGGADVWRLSTAGSVTSRHQYPETNNTYDLGSTSLRWRNIYTNDLNLSNEGGANDVDGTWGDFTIQEGESDLFLINKRSGKKYKFNLTEVS